MQELLSGPENASSASQLTTPVAGPAGLSSPSLPPFPSTSITNGLYGHQPEPFPYNLLLNPAVNPSFQLISAAQGDTLKMKCCSYLWPRSAKKVRPKA